MMINLKYIIILVFLFISCNQSYKKELEDDISNYLDVSCIEDSCSIDLSSVTKFDWDTLYVFKEIVSSEEIERIINMKYSISKGANKSWIFVKNHNIVYNQIIFENYTTITNGRIYFDISDSINYKMYVNPIFSAIKVPLGGNDYYYILTQ